MTPHSVGRCPKDRGDRRPLGEPFFKRVFLNNSCKNSYKNNTDNGTVYFIDQNTADSYISRVSISAETNSSADRMYK